MKSRISVIRKPSGNLPIKNVVVHFVWNTFKKHLKITKKLEGCLWYAKGFRKTENCLFMLCALQEEWTRKSLIACEHFDQEHTTSNQRMLVESWRVYLLPMDTYVKCSFTIHFLWRSRTVLPSVPPSTHPIERKVVIIMLSQIFIVCYDPLTHHQH